MVGAAVLVVEVLELEDVLVLDEVAVPGRWKGWCSAGVKQLSLLENSPKTPPGPKMSVEDASPFSVEAGSSSAVLLLPPLLDKPLPSTVVSKELPLLPMPQLHLESGLEPSAHRPLQMMLPPLMMTSARRTARFTGAGVARA